MVAPDVFTPERTAGACNVLSIGNVRRLALPADAAPVVQGTCAVLAAAALLIARASAASDAEPTSPGAARPAPGTLEITE
jgi:hypothetical protein